MNNIKLPVYPNKLLDDLKDDNFINSASIKINKENNYIILERESDDLIFDEKYNPSQNSSDLYKNHLKKTVSIIKNFLKENGISRAKCVDVGCGKGEFVNLLNEDKYFNCIGFDTSYEGSSNKIKKRYLNKKDFNTEVNLVILKYVLDYIYSPYDFLNTLKEIFPNAYIYIEGPYVEDTIKKNRFYDICFEQINYFSKKTYSNLFNNKILNCGNTFGDQYFYLISHFTHLNKNSISNFKKEKFKTTNLGTLFPEMNIQLKKLKEIYDEAEKLWFWGAARKTVMILHHFTECYKLALDFSKFGCVDQNNFKENKYLPSTKIKVLFAKNFLRKVKENDIIIVSNPLYRNEIEKYLNSNLNFKPKITILR